MAASETALRAIAPNLARLASTGSTRRVITNAQATQFVLPALFSQTYPLDYGGYNNGIRERPKSFVELLQEAGYATHLAATCNAMGLTLSFDRGFDVVHSAVDYRHLLEYRIDKQLKYELDLLERNEIDDSEAKAKIIPELDLVLQRIQESVAGSEKSQWPKSLTKINRQVEEGCPAERALLKHKPDVVLSKIKTIRSNMFWRFLGKEDAGKTGHLWLRFKMSINWRLRRFAVKYGFPLFPLGHYQVLCGEIMGGVCDLISEARKPWYLHLHIMDLHDCQSINRPFHLLGRLRFLGRWLSARRRGLTGRSFLYDSVLMYLDRQVGRLLDTLERSGQSGNTVIIVTGDHGSHAAGSPRSKKPEIGFRTHYEDIEVPLIVAGTDGPMSDEGLIDSMSVSATLLDALEIPQHQSFKGRSAFATGRDAVISECAGAGNADLARRDLYFTVTTATHKLMAVLKGDGLSARELYDLADDPAELNNLVDDPEMCNTAESLLSVLYQERKDLFAARGVAPGSFPR